MLEFARKASKTAMMPLGWPTRRRSGDVVILAYHRVGNDRSEIELPADTLASHLEELRSTERILTLAEAVAGHPDGGVVITFDDGYRDFYDTALPLLVRFEVPATLYLATGLVTEGHAVSDPRALTWAQLSEAVGTGLVTVGSHTHGHTDLSRASEAVSEIEMRRSKELIEDNLGISCDHFAYPWAVGSPASGRAARRLFKTAALDAWRTNRAGQIDPYRLGRVPILRSDGRFFFRRKVRGELDSEAWLYRMVGRGPWGRS